MIVMISYDKNLSTANNRIHIHPQLMNHPGLKADNKDCGVLVLIYSRSPNPTCLSLCLVWLPYESAHVATTNLFGSKLVVISVEIF